MNLPKRLWYYMFGPKLIRSHGSRANHQGENYKPNDLETTAQKVLTIYKVSRVILTYTMPVWAILVYRKGYYTFAHLFGFAKFAGWISLFYVSLLFIRGFGRAYNPQYVMFLNSFGKSFSDVKEPANKKLRDYDFDFNHWPVDFSWNQDDPSRSKRNTISSWKRLSSQHSGFFSTLFLGYPKDFFAYLVAHSFGISMIYPGSTSMFQAACSSVAADGRRKLVEENHGYRAKLRTEDGNSIDTMFVDKRNRGSLEQSGESPNGDVLVICCEGNAGFYEGGCMVTPLGMGFSVLGWNHPGFLGSSGQPFPEAEKNAIDVVIQYAIRKLGFQPPNIIIFAWSIGAFSAINAAASYPDIKGLFLDSTFNDISLFAKKVMPEFADGFVQFTVRNHLNLNNAENLRLYKGPVSFIRRCEDEVMNIDGPHNVASNLGNLLLEDFLRSRYPNLFESTGADCLQTSALRDWLHADDAYSRDTLLNRWGVSSSFCQAALVRCLKERGSSFPMPIGENLSAEEKVRVLLFLANKYMNHFESTHCTPLPGNLFTQPWDPIMLLDKNSQNLDDFEGDKNSQSNNDFEVIE